jgi:hypothetical protein
MTATLLIAGEAISSDLGARAQHLAFDLLCLLVAYWHGNAYILDTDSVLGGLKCGLWLRFEFLGE